MKNKENREEIEIAKIVSYSLCPYTTDSIDDHWRWRERWERRRFRKAARRIIAHLRERGAEIGTGAQNNEAGRMTEKGQSHDE